MIRLGLRFSLRGAREGRVRLVLTALGVALAVTLLLFTISGFNGLKARDLHDGWLSTSGQNRLPSVDESLSDPLWWRTTWDVFEGRLITIVQVAATGPRSPLVPGAERLPGPGEYLVSPALAGLLATTPAELLGDRFAGTQVGVLGRAALSSPESLLVVAGRSPSELENASDAVQVRSLETAPKEHDYSYFMRIALGIGAIGLMLPVLVFVMTSTRLAAARREERLAALRLIGATPGQVNVVSTVEAALAAVAGTAFGFALFFAFRPLVARIPFTGERFFTSDLGLGALSVAGIAIGVPVAAVLAGLWTLRRVQISPLGVTRKAPARRPSAWRLLAPVVAIALLLVPAQVNDSTFRTYSVFVVFAAIALGIMLVGPWLTHLGGRLLANFARRDSTLIAARRLGADPRRAFRAISGLVLAVFMGTVFVSIIATAMSSGSGSFDKTDLPDSMMVQQYGGSADGYLGAEATSAVVAKVAGLEGVRWAAPVLQIDQSVAGGGEPGATGDTIPAGDAGDPPVFDPDFTGLVTDQQWLQLGGSPEFVTDTGWVAVEANELSLGRLQTVEVPAGVTTAGRALELVVLTDGAKSSVERVRTVLAVALPDGPPAYSLGELHVEQNAFFNLLGRMVDVGIILCLVIAGCSLAVSVAGGLIERKRAFALLRLTGMPLRKLYRAVLVEAAVPLVLAAVVSALAGFFVAALIYWNTGGGFTVAVPGASYFGMVIGGQLTALAIVGLTLPLVGRMTEPESVRME